MGEMIDKLKTYKFYILVMVYMVFTAITGGPGPGEEATAFGMTGETLKMEIMSLAALALKAKWNRTQPG